MSSKLHEAEAPEMKLEEIHAADMSPGEQDQQGKELRSKRFGPENVSPRYELRTSKRNEIQPNVATKRSVESPLPGEPSTKRGRMPTSTLKDSGRKRKIPEKSLRQMKQQIGSSSSEVSFQEVFIREAEFFGLINRRIQVYWSLDKLWYTGLVKRYDPTNKLHHVVYDDGEEEWVSLERDKFKIQILFPGEFSTIPNSGTGQSKCDDLDNRSIEHTKQGNIECLQQVSTDCLQKIGIDSSQKKTSRRKVLREEQKGGMHAIENSQKKTTRNNLLKEEQKKGGIDVSEKQNSKRGKQFHGIDGGGIQHARSSQDIIPSHGIAVSGSQRTRRSIHISQEVATSNEDRKSPTASVSNHSSSGAEVKPSNEERKSPTASVSNHSINGAEDGATGSRKSSSMNVYTRRSRPKSSVRNIGASFSSCTNLGSHKVAGNAYVYKRPKNSIHRVDDSSTRPSSSGAGETCICSRGNEQAAIGELGDPSDIELEKVPMNAEVHNCPENSKTNIHNSPGVGETCIGSRGDEHAAIGASTLADRGAMELGKGLVNAEFQDFSQNIISNIDNASGVGETCMGSRVDGHAGIGALALADHSDIDLEKVLVNPEFQFCPQNLKTNIDNAGGVGETSMGSRGDGHAAMGASALVDRRDMDLERAPMNAEFQNCSQNLKTNVGNASGVGETCMGSRGDEHAATGASALADCSDTELEKAPMNSEFQNFPRSLKSNIDNASVSTFSSRFDDCTRSNAGQESSLETATSAGNTMPFTYSRKRPRKGTSTECSEVPVKRVRTCSLEETAVSHNAKGKEVCRGIHGERESANSRPSSYDMIPNYRFDEDVSNFGDDTSCSTNLKHVPERSNTSTDLKVHMSPLYLREPSYWQCISSVLQLYKMCPVNISRSDGKNIECAKLLSWENLLVFLGTVFRFLNAGSEPSSSLCHTQMALQKFEAGGLLNARRYTDLPLWECLQSMIMSSDVKVELLVFDTMSNAHKLCFWGTFSEVLCNFSMSLASLMSSAANRFPAEMFGAARPVNLNGPIQSIAVRFSSLQNGAWSPLICSFENLHNRASVNWNDCKRTLNWFVSSSKTLIQGESSKSNLGNLFCSSHRVDYRGKALVRAGVLCKYKQGAEVVNDFKRSVENQYFTSSLFQRFNSQYVSAVCLNQSEKPLGRIVQCHQPVPSICTTFVDSPNFFQYLHLKLLFGKAIHPDCSQSHGSLPSAEVPNKPTRKRRLSIRMQELVSEDGDLEADKWSAAKRLTLEDHNSLAVNDTIAPSSALSSGFDVNVTGTSSEVLPMQKNLAPVFPILKFPILKFQRRSTDERSWHLAGNSVTSSSYKGRTSRHTTHVDSLQSRHTEPDLNKGHFVRENQREYNMLQSGAAYGGRIESSQSGCSLSISDNADGTMLKSERPARRGRPSQQDKKEQNKDVGSDSQRCATNILVFGRGQSRRETGAEVALEALSLNEWVLNVKLHGSTRFRYKAQEPKIPKAHELRLPKAGEQTFGNPNFHPIIWTGGQDWNLEFTERKQWFLFRKMYEECYCRNLRAASIKNIPIPTVREINVDNLSTVRIPFERPMNYIHTEDEVSRALFGGRVVYDMDSDDEEWLGRFNSAEADYDTRANEVSEDTFEAIIDMLEKAAFMQECDLLTVAEALQLCSEFAPDEVLTSIHAHWLGKREQKGTALIREFQRSPSKRRNHGGKSLRGKTFRGQHSGKSFIGQPYMRNWEAGTSTEMQQQFNGITSGSEGSSDVVGMMQNMQQQFNGITSGSEGSSDVVGMMQNMQQQFNGITSGSEGSSDVGLYLHAEVEKAARAAGERVEEAMEAARAAREIAAAKRQRVHCLVRNADMKIYKAVVATRNAETIREVEQARFLRCQTREQFPTDSRIIENVNGSGLSL